VEPAVRTEAESSPWPDTFGWRSNELPQGSIAVNRRTFLERAGLLGAVAVAVAVRDTRTGFADAPYRAFSADSWFNTPLATITPEHDNQASILSYLQNAPESSGGYLRLAGTGSNRWGQPVYWAQLGDAVYNVRCSSALRPPELSALRIPADMHAATTSDGALTLFDVDAGYVTAFTRMAFANGGWSADGATVTYLASNGLHYRTGLSNDPRNQGSHRGNNGATMMARHDEVLAGGIEHVMKISSGPECSNSYCLPLVGSDGDFGYPQSPIKQGLRMRLRDAVDVTGFPTEARVIAEALKRYGVYFGDSGGTTTLKLENTVAEGRGQLWTVDTDALSGLPFTEAYWQVLPESYGL